MRPEQYDLLYQCEQDMWWFAGMRAITSTLLAGVSRPGLRCLEAGCGTGLNSRFFEQQYGWQVFPFDLSDYAIRYSQRREVSRLARASASLLPYTPEAFDGVTCLDVIYMVAAEARASALREFHRVTRRGGFLLVRVPALRSMSGGHSRAVAEVHRFRVAELAAEIEASGFRVRRATYANMLLLPLAAVKRKLLEPLGIARDDGDVRMPGRLLNRAFLAALRVENALLKQVDHLPIGLSAIVLAERG